MQSKGVIASEFLNDYFGLDGEGGGEFRELGRKGGREGGDKGEAWMSERSIEWSEGGREGGVGRTKQKSWNPQEEDEASPSAFGLRNAALLAKAFVTFRLVEEEEEEGAREDGREGGMEGGREEWTRVV